jgi:hypothetical protein
MSDIEQALQTWANSLDDEARARAIAALELDDDQVEEGADDDGEDAHD